MAQKNCLGRILKKYESAKITKEELRCLLEKCEIGKVTGVIGPFVLRYHNDKLIISDRPKIFRRSMSPAAIAGRNNFSAMVKFAKFLNSIEPIKEIWKHADVEGRTGWTKLQKHNDIKGLHPTAKNTITPGKYHFETDQICSFKEDFQLNINYKSAYNEQMIILIVPYDPIDKGNHFEIFRVEGISLSEDQIELCRKYKRFILYSAVVRSNGEWSNTVVQEGSFAIISDEEFKQVYFYLLFLLQKYLIAEFSKIVKKKYTLRL